MGPRSPHRTRMESICIRRASKLFEISLLALWLSLLHNIGLFSPLDLSWRCLLPGGIQAEYELLLSQNSPDAVSFALSGTSQELESQMFLKRGLLILGCGPLAAPCPRGHPGSDGHL